jgi:hypothetical protein
VTPTGLKTPTTLRSSLSLLCVLCVLCGLGIVRIEPVLAQGPFQIDPRQMSGIPRPDTQQAPRSVSVRVIRGDLSNNIANQPVDLQVDGKTQTVKTDENGRAQFENLPPGARLKAVTVVDGERLESQDFPAPTQPGIRLMLVATDREKETRKNAEAAAPAVTGEVTISSQSYIAIEPADESIEVFYLLNISNPSRTPVNPPSIFMFDTPADAQGTTIMEGSAPQATANGTRIRVQGPLPVSSSGAVEIKQTFPASMEHLAVMVKKQGDVKLSSPQIDRQQDMPGGGEMYIAAAGDKPIAAGQPITLAVSGLPHHSIVPRWTALTLALGIALAGVWAARKPVDPKDRGSERKQLIARREKLFQDLLRLEHDQRRGKVDQSKYAARREELLAGLEHVYGALDTDDTSPEPATRAGLAA